MKILVITGPPYSGKGTQCQTLKEQLGYKHISTGERCRFEKEKRTLIGNVMSTYEEKGNLVPDSIMKDLFSQILDENNNEMGIILDGYPRTKSQVDDLIELTESKGLEVGNVINIEVPKSELLNRAKTRAETSTRKDDKDVNIHIKRIDVFEHMTKPAIEYMKSKLLVNSYNGMGLIEEITLRIKEGLK